MPEVVTRGNLPHWYKPGFAHFITYRLADTIPSSLIQSWRAEREAQLRRRPPPGVLPVELRDHAHKQFFAKYDNYLDNVSHERAWLADPRIAAIVRENLYHHHGSLYELIAYSIMPNHVHVLLPPFECALVDEAASFVSEKRLAAQEAGSFVSGRGDMTDEAGSFVYGCGCSDERPDGRSPWTRIIHSLNSFTANECNRALGRRGKFWQHESYDHWARDDDETARIVEYINGNAVRTRLCQRP